MDLTAGAECSWSAGIAPLGASVRPIRIIARRARVSLNLEPTSCSLVTESEDQRTSRALAGKAPSG